MTNRASNPIPRAARRVVLLFLIVCLAASACASDGDDNAASSADGSGLFPDPAPAAQSPSQAPQLAPAPPPDPAPAPAPDPAPVAVAPEAESAASEDRESGDDGDSGDAMAEGPDSEEELAGPVAAQEPPSSEGDPDDAEGLFAPPESDEPEPPPTPTPIPDRLEDNRFVDYGYRQFIEADVDPLSTFALDVDTGSYTVTRRWLDEGAIPPPEAVRAEEVINWFDYDYDVPRRGLEISVDGGPSPFDSDNVLVRVGVQAEEVADLERPPVALTFIVDTSGSMDRDDRLGLVRESLHLLVDQLDDDDTVAIVIYSNNAGTILEPTAVRDDDEIHDAIDSLTPGGSTNLESGLRTGYELAEEAFRSDGVNRVIIASDGVANAGVTDQGELSNFIRDYADEGIQLVTVGYGMGNFNDALMEQLADNGDGFYAYVDTIDEAERIFEDELTSTLITAAIDAKIQVEFDPEIVDEYRLIGFENRGVLDNDFRNDEIDAGELGAGHQVTAMYEIELKRGVSLDDRGDIGEVFLRWEDPTSGDVIEIDRDIDLRDVSPDWNDTAPDFRLATVATAFAEVLRDNPYADDVNLKNIHVEAKRVADEVDSDKADEFVDLVGIASDLY